MAEQLLSVGLDVGTTTTQLVLSRLTAQNRANAFSVPQMEITGRELLYRSPVRFTPLVRGELVDGQALKTWVSQEYEKAGIRPEQVDTGAVIITGETSRKENAGTVLQALSQFAGDFVVATAGPDLESILAAKGAGAVERSQKTGARILHMDIGGGTSNLALIEEGEVVRTGCLNVGGRLVKLENGAVSYVSPAVRSLTSLEPGDIPTRRQLTDLARTLSRALEMAAGLEPPDPLLDALMTKEVKTPWKIPEGPLELSFSGGVADCIDRDASSRDYGDMGPLLGKAIRESKLCRGPYRLGRETIRATVIGAGSHSTQLSGSTVFYRDMELPLKNLPVAAFTRREQDSPDFARNIADRLSRLDSDLTVLALPGYENANYQDISRLAEKILQAVGEKSILICLEQDMAKALGHKLCLHLKPGQGCLCIDRVRLTQESFLDIGTPIGPCLPVVIKTLILNTTSGSENTL